MKIRFLGGPEHWALKEQVSPGEFIYIPLPGNNDFKYRVVPPGIYKDYVDGIAIPAKYDSLWEWRGSPEAMHDQGITASARYHENHTLKEI